MNLDHTTVSATDKWASARLMAEIPGVDEPVESRAFRTIPSTPSQDRLEPVRLQTRTRAR